MECLWNKGNKEFVFCDYHNNLEVFDNETERLLFCLNCQLMQNRIKGHRHFTETRRIKQRAFKTYCR